MSEYNHFRFLKLDPLGELNFMFNKLCKGMYAFGTTMLVNVFFAFGGWQARKVQRAGTGGEILVQHH